MKVYRIEGTTTIIEQYSEPELELDKHTEVLHPAKATAVRRLLEQFIEDLEKEHSVDIYLDYNKIEVWEKRS